MEYKTSNRGERGAALLEFAIIGMILFTALFGVVEFGRLLWTHNALKDATRRGARYAIVRKSDASDAVKKVVVYGDPNANVSTAKPLVNGLTMSNVTVEYKNFDGIRLSANAIVSVKNYKFNFMVPVVGRVINLPSYRTSMPGESVGFVPCDIPSATPEKPCNIIPN